MELPINKEIYNSLNFIKNKNIMHSIYFFKDKTKSTNYKQRLNYHLHKVSRKFVFEIIKNFTNLHGCGLFAYVSLLAHANSNFKKRIKAVYAWVKGNEKYFKKILNVKNKKEVFRQLDVLKDVGLINYRIKDDEIIVFMLEGTVDIDCAPPRKKIIAQYAAIKSHTGYFFVNENNVDDLIKRSDFYSEADILVDLWLNTIFNDKDVDLSTTPIVYLDENRNNPEMNISVTTAQLSRRWGCSYGRVNKLLKKIESQQLIQIYILPNIGTVIFNKAYIDFFATEHCYIEDKYKTYKHFYKKKAFVKYLIQLFKQRLNYNSKKDFLFEFIRFFKHIKINPYKKIGRKKKSPFIYRILSLLSLFDFESKPRYPLVERVLLGFLKRVMGNYINIIYIN